jgi:hypothetical protein
MNKSKNLLVTFYLLAIFILPQAVQYFHILNVKHHVSHCDIKCKNLGTHFHEASEHCPLHDFAFYTPDNFGQKIIISKPQIFIKIIEISYQKPEFQFFEYCCFSRAPPVFKYI